MSPNKRKTMEQDTFLPESNSTENDVEPLITDSEAASLRQELRAAIATMGPNTPQFYSDRFSVLEGSLDNSQSQFNPNTCNKNCIPSETEVKELYKKELDPPSDDSQSEIDVENIDSTSKSSNKDISIMVRSNELETLSPPRKRKVIPKHFSQGGYVLDTNKRISRLDRHSVTRWFRNRTIFSKKDKDQVNEKSSMEFYKMCMSQPEDDHSPPRRVIFNLVNELPKPKCSSKGVNTKIPIYDHVFLSKNIKDRKNKKAKTVNEEEESVVEYVTLNKRNETIQHKIKKCHCGGPARVDVYYFDHGNASYLRTTDNPPLIRSEIVADQSEECNNKFWGEIFGTVHIGTSFITSFILQFFRFLLQGIIRPLTIGLLQISSDYCFKPFLATLYNAVIQPPLICFYNVSTSLRDICDPLAEGFGYFIKEIALIIKSCRLVEIKNSRPGENVHAKDNTC